MERIPTAIIGASGYAGAELIRLLHNHPHVAISGLYANRRAGEPIARALFEAATEPLVGRVERD